MRTFITFIALFAQAHTALATPLPATPPNTVQKKVLVAKVQQQIEKLCRSEFSVVRARQKAQHYAPLIVSAAQQYKLPTMLVTSVIWHESHFDPLLVSPAGARGLMQVMPFHFKKHENWRNPTTNLQVGCRIMRSYYNRFGNWHRALTAYCYGPYSVSRGKYRSRYSQRVLNLAP